MPSSESVLVALALSLSACSAATAADGGVGDAGTRVDEGTAVDAGAPVDAAPPPDAGPPAVYCGSDSPTGFDGPAELPRVYVASDVADSPAPGATVHVAAGGDLQGALDAASCGDTITLEAGATFTGQFVLREKACDDLHWIVVRSDAPDSALPPEHARMTPCGSGVATLPGRPDLDCTTPTHATAKLVLGGATSGLVSAEHRANHYRLMGLELTRVDGGAVGALVTTDGADHVVLDRCWIHGTAVDETSAGVVLGESQHVAVIDSTITDIHCMAAGHGSGACTDAQAVATGPGHTAQGPYRIARDFLEASGENVLLGGLGATTDPTDVEIRCNHLFKPLSWDPDLPGFDPTGPTFATKNLLDLTSGVRVLVENDVLEDCWGGFSQSGRAVLFTPQGGPSRLVDVTVRSDVLRHLGGGLTMLNGISADSGLAPADGGRYSIHDVILDDVDANRFRGSGSAFLVITATSGAPPLHDVVVDHVTLFEDPSTHLMSIVGPDPAAMSGFALTNSIAVATLHPIASAAPVMGSCATSSDPLMVLAACFRDPSPMAFGGTVIIGSPDALPPSHWPSGALFAADAAAVGFVDYAAGDYRLAPGSPYRGMATDGGDPGAHVDALLSATRLVR